MNFLPFAVINFVSTNIFEEDSRSSAKAMVNLSLRITRTESTLTFLGTCLEHSIIPRFIEDWFVKIPTTSKKATLRKLSSLKKELLRDEITEQRCKLEHLRRDFGYVYLHVTRRCDKDFVDDFLDRLQHMVRAEESTSFRRHSHKWSDLTDSNFPVCSYFFDHSPRFPFPFTDSFLCKRQDTTAPFHISDKFTNESLVSIPEPVALLLEKGPTFRVPPKLDNKLMTNINLSLETLTYKLRWFEALKMKTTPKLTTIPFHKNSVNLPPKMNDEKEKELISLKHEIIRAAKTEITSVSKSSKYKNINKQIHFAKSFLQKNNLVAVASDKTKKIVIENSKDLISRTEDILADTVTYKPITKSRQTAISRQANTIVKSLGKSLSKTDSLRLLATGCRPAQFHTLVKDHKMPDKKGFPLRPIAAVNNTATEKVDWLVSQILSQLIQYVPANIKNAEDLTNKLKNLDSSSLSNSKCFISLDVVQLYPSIPIDFGINAVLEVAEAHWSTINNFGASTDDLRRALNFICYNYEIEFNDSVFLQRKGCPMGAHFAPPFAIIALHKIESQALAILEEQLNLKPLVYARYIDDIFMGPYPKNTTDFEAILQVFNSINDSIKFTAEVPKDDQPLNFLDISVSIDDQRVRYSWFTKNCHSNIILKPDSWLPKHVKTNFIANSVKQVAKKCSDPEEKSVALNKLNNRLRSNGYKNVNFQKILSRKGNSREEKEQVFFKTSFINDKFNRKINKILQQYNFPVKVVSEPNKKLNQVLGPIHKKTKHDHCLPCSYLPDKYTCNDRYLVYMFTCNRCKMNYIGETCRPFFQRFDEHKRSLKARDNKSALAEHLIKDHPDIDSDLQNFQLCVLAKLRTPVETRIKEAQFIDRLRPKLNRKLEMARW